MKWNDDLIKLELLKSIKVLNLNRMPTGEELKSIGRNDLHCKISRTKKYSGWAKELGLELKSSETSVGQYWEKKIANELAPLHFIESVELMTSKHPYDLLVNGTVKIDVKVANPYLLRGKNRVHTFALNKIKPTCDIYICIALNESGEYEKVLIIPSHHVNMKMINIGKESKYDKYNLRWTYIYRYSEFFDSIK
jgi:hypothetical protein